jgi:predicted PurR-regulated permease PerM
MADAEVPGPEDGEAPPEGQEAEESAAPDTRRSTWRWLRAACIAITLFYTYQLLALVQSAVAAVLAVALYLVFGAVIAFLAGPPVDLLERRVRLPRSPAILLVLLSGIGLVVGAAILIGNPLIAEARSLYQQAPALLDQLNQVVLGFNGLLHRLGFNVDVQSITAAFSNQALELLYSGVKATPMVLIDVVIVFVVAFWLLRDGELLRAGLVEHLPGRLRSEVDFGLDAVGVVVGGYVRAQLLMALILGVLAGAGCAIIGVPYPLVVGVAAAVFELVPLVGPFLGGTVAMLLALTVSGTLCIATAVLFVGIHIVESYLLAPRIQARFIRLHPLVALLALLAGIDLGGFLGALFAVPVASLIAVFLRAALGDWRAQRPDVFSSKDGDRFLERRRRRLLGEFRLFRRESN